MKRVADETVNIIILGKPVRKVKGLNRILLVDDDEITNLVHKRTIENSGIDVIVDVASNGREALDYLQRREKGKTIIPDLILLDINMPEMDGWDFLDKFGEYPAEHRAKIVVVMLTTSMRRDDLSHAVETEDVNKYMYKSLTPERFEEIIARHFPE